MIKTSPQIGNIYKETHFFLKKITWKNPGVEKYKTEVKNSLEELSIFALSKEENQQT